MFGSSTQRNSWLFQSEDELTSLRRKANQNYIDKFRSSKSFDARNFLTAEEELHLVREYGQRLRQFCLKFEDPRDARIRMPLYVTTTAIHYYYRYFIYNSVMDYHPKDIMHTCIYLACKIEEFYVTIGDYIHNIEGSQETKKLTAQAILNSELQTTQELQFHLIIHQPYRPLEGLMIDLKTRYPVLQDAESLRPMIEDFLAKVHMTDAILLYAPSQLAIAATTTAASKMGFNLDEYVTGILFKDNKNSLPTLVDAVRKIKRYVKHSNSRCSAAELQAIENRLETCRNPENDPTTEEYAIKQARLEQDDDDFVLTSSTAANADTLQDDDLQVLDDVEEDTPATEQRPRYSRPKIGNPVPDPWNDESEQYHREQIGGIIGVGLGMRSAGGIVMDGGVIDDDDQDYIVESMNID